MNSHLNIAERNCQSITVFNLRNKMRTKVDLTGINKDIYIVLFQTRSLPKERAQFPPKCAICFLKVPISLSNLSFQTLNLIRFGVKVRDIPCKNCLQLCIGKRKRTNILKTYRLLSLTFDERVLKFSFTIKMSKTWKKNFSLYKL